MRLVDAIPVGWREVLGDEFEQPYMHELAAFVAEAGSSILLKQTPIVWPSKHPAETTTGGFVSAASRLNAVQ